ncbi:MAG TPA: hypothetical protein PKN47_01520 [Nitrospira sp.]|nr:hypothetical protein [Nitrospira sp.]
MPVTTVSLTVEEFEGIMSRLTALESWMAARQSDLAPLVQRVQGVEATLAAFSKTVAELPKIASKTEAAVATK